jgi:hypothetical protein
LQEAVQRTEETGADHSEWDWNTPQKGNREKEEVIAVIHHEDENEKRGKKGMKKKKHTKNTKKELDFFGFGGRDSKDATEQRVEHGGEGFSGSVMSVGDLEAGTGSFPVATPQFDPARQRFEDENEGGNGDDSTGIGEVLGLTDSISSLLPQRLMAGLGADTLKISSFFDAGDEDDDKGRDPLLEQVERNRIGAGSPITDVGWGTGRSAGEVMKSIQSFDTRAAFRKYQGTKEDMRRLSLNKGAGGRGEEEGASESQGNAVLADGASKQASPSPSSSQVEARAGLGVGGMAWLVASAFLRAAWFLLSSLINLLLRAMNAKARLPTMLSAATDSSNAAGAAGAAGAGGAVTVGLREWGVTCINKTWSVLMTPTGASLVVLSLLLLSYLKVREFFREMEEARG